MTYEHARGPIDSYLGPDDPEFMRSIHPHQCLHLRFVEEVRLEGAKEHIDIWITDDDKGCMEDCLKSWSSSSDTEKSDDEGPVSY